MDVNMILELINSYAHLTELCFSAEDQLVQLEATAPEAYAALRDNIGSIALQEAIDELCLIAEGYKMDAIEMVVPTAPNATLEEMQKRWDDLWMIYSTVMDEELYFRDEAEVIEDCISKQRELIIEAGFEQEIDMGV